MIKRQSVVRIAVATQPPRCRRVSDPLHEHVLSDVPTQKQKATLCTRPSSQLWHLRVRRWKLEHLRHSL
ncbi:unnamed protein product [Acanthoscelides obtectus]|uniref:Uncharacterized protein n=1 Tax=Acanthoscelides obtectus TaxID=200917 RepID=A0A9P0JTU8_ACAOB|nr:unnamed protein product [Acanthoscelides obtectus]CAK1679231.1 hypothetical protein AOBTE_LOCUS32179 [Acanthoscelides obtectus]